MNALQALLTRTSWARLVEPVPDAAQMETMFQAALRAPDHGMLRPWKFLTIEGEARNKLGDLYVDSLKPETPEREKKLRTAPLRAPLIIVAATCFKEHPTIPEIEQVEATAAAVQNLSLAAYAMGYGTLWRTGPPAFNSDVKVGLGLDKGDEIVGFIYVGTPTVVDRKVPVNETTAYVESWEG